jgi:tRNA threonylcarbamoyladenosine biosynthesis protein TsaE
MASIPTGEFVTHSAEETFELAYRIGESLETSAVFLLRGDLGAGKTVFAKGIGAGLEIDPAEVNSPTFTIMNQHAGRMRMYHLDLYRIEGGATEIRELGLEELVEDPAGVIVIEWPERLGSFAIPGGYLVNIVDCGMNERLIRIDLCRRAS